MKPALLCLAVILIAAEMRGQTQPPQYRIQVRVRESGPQFKTKESTHGLLLQADAKGSLNASYRIPYYSSTKGEAKELHTVALGNIIDCFAREAQDGVRLECSFESSFVSERQRAAPPPLGFPPLIQSRVARTTATVAFGHEVAMAELDDPTTGNRLEFFVTAERAGPR